MSICKKTSTSSHREEPRTEVFCHICWIHQAGSPESLKDSRCLGQEKKAFNKRLLKTLFQFHKFSPVSFVRLSANGARHWSTLSLASWGKDLPSKVIWHKKTSVPADCSNSSVWREGTQGKGKEFHIVQGSPSGVASVQVEHLGCKDITSIFEIRHSFNSCS